MRTVTGEIQSLYEEHDAEMYVDFPSMVNGIREHLDRINYVMELIHRYNPATMLDVGCNRGLFGYLSRWNHQQDREITGVDISRTSASFAQEKMGYDKVHVLNASEPFILCKQFDLVLCMELLEHVPDPPQLVDNIFMHVKVGGRAIFSCPNEREPVDGEFHVRHVSLGQLEAWVSRSFGFAAITTSFTLPSHFCEKPRWQGWHFVVAVKSA